MKLLLDVRLVDDELAKKQIFYIEGKMKDEKIILMTQILIKNNLCDRGNKEEIALVDECINNSKKKLQELLDEKNLIEKALYIKHKDLEKLDAYKEFDIE